MNVIRIGFASACTALLVACGTTPTASHAPVATPHSATPDGSGKSSVSGAANGMAASTVAAVTLPAHLDPGSALSSERSVYFELERFEIGDPYLAVIDRHGKYLSKNPGLAVRIEGNADERGSPEYNLALGQKRAQAVLSALKLYGIRDAQVEAVSYGEERPKAHGSDEASWSQNRRADIVYPAR